MDKNVTSSAEKWIGKISAYEKEFKQWENRAAKIVKIYRDNDSMSESKSAPTSFNILWSNVQTCLPATFARLPRPDVSRRYRDNDPVGRVASMILERALEFEIEHYPDYRAAMENSVLDRFLGGRGISWVRYEPHFKAAEMGMPEDGFQITEDADDSEDTPEAEAEEEIDYECAPVDYVHWKDFGHVVARTWEEVPAVWRKVYMSRPALIDRFGEELGNKIPLDTRPEELKKASSGDDSLYEACVYEIWDKSSNKAIWLSKSMGRILDERSDPLELEGFFPCPRPLYATTTTDNLVPVPDYKLYQDQAKELNNLAEKISKLIVALQVKGVYDNSIPELARLFSEATNTQMIPVKTWAAFAEKNGLKGAIDLVDIAPIAIALSEAYKSVDQVKNQIYEIMGISDIVRGSSDPRETATAVKTKGQFGGMRLRAMQSKVHQYATEILQIKAQIMCTLFQPDTLIKISAAEQLAEADQQYIMPAVEMLKNSPLRNFRIEVSSDSMIQMDEAQEKQDRMEFLNATGTFLQKALPVAQQSPQIAPLLVDMLKFGVTAFKVGKSIEGTFDQVMDSLKEAAANPQPKPNPELEKIQATSQAKQAELQMKSQLDQQTSQQDLQVQQAQLQMQAMFEKQAQQNAMELELHKQQVQAQQIQHQNELEAQRATLESQNSARLEEMRQMREDMRLQSQQQFDLLMARLDHATKIEVAEVSKQTTLEAAQINAAKAATDNGEAI